MVHSVKFGSVVLKPASSRPGTTTSGMVSFYLANDAKGNDLDRFKTLTRSYNSNEIMLKVTHPKHVNSSLQPTFEFHTDDLPLPKPVTLLDQVLTSAIIKIMPLKKHVPVTKQDFADFTTLIDKAEGSTKSQKRVLRKALSHQRDLYNQVLERQRNTRPQPADSGTGFLTTLIKDLTRLLGPKAQIKVVKVDFPPNPNPDDAGIEPLDLTKFLEDLGPFLKNSKNNPPLGDIFRDYPSGEDDLKNPKKP